MWVVRLVAALFSHLHFKLDQQDVLGWDFCDGWMTFPLCLPCSSEATQTLAFHGILANSRILFTLSPGHLGYFISTHPHSVLI